MFTQLTMRVDMLCQSAKMCYNKEDKETRYTKKSHNMPPLSVPTLSHSHTQYIYTLPTHTFFPFSNMP